MIKRSIFVLVLTTLIVFSACKKDKNDSLIPNVPVNVTIYLSLPQYSSLNSIGNNAIIQSAGYRGIMLLSGGSAEPKLLFERTVVGAAMRGDRLVFSDGDSLFVSTVALLRQQKAEAQLRLGKVFGPGDFVTYDPGSSGALSYLEAAREMAHREGGAA